MFSKILNLGAYRRGGFLKRGRRGTCASQPPELRCLHLSLSASISRPPCRETARERGGGRAEQVQQRQARAGEKHTAQARPGPGPDRTGPPAWRAHPPTLQPFTRQCRVPNNGVSRRMQARTREQLHSSRQHGLGLTTCCKYVVKYFCSATQT